MFEGEAPSGGHVILYMLFIVCVERKARGDGGWGEGGEELLPISDFLYFQQILLEKGVANRKPADEADRSLRFGGDTEEISAYACVLSVCLFFCLPLSRVCCY